MDKLALEIRNVQVVTSWDILSMFTKMSYKEKIDYLMKEYYQGKKNVEKIIKESREEFEEE